MSLLALALHGFTKANVVHSLYHFRKLFTSIGHLQTAPKHPWKLGRHRCQLDRVYLEHKISR